MTILWILLAICVVAFVVNFSQRRREREERTAALVGEMMWRASSGDPEGNFEMGTAYQYGHGVTQDLVLASVAYGEAARKGHSGAQGNLGLLYAMGWGVQKDLKRALELFTLAADQGNAEAQNNLCRMYSLEMGSEKDFVRAYMWLELAIGGLEGAQREKAIRNRDGFLAANMSAEEIERGREMAKEWKVKKGQKRADTRHND